MKEPLWISLPTLHLLHDRQLELFGGLRGVRDEGAIESALARPLNKWAYESDTDLSSLAAAYLCSLSRQQGYLDGNKRCALAATLVFLGINGFRLEAPGPELYAIVISAATGEIGIDQVAVWIKAHLIARA